MKFPHHSITQSVDEFTTFNNNFIAHKHTASDIPKSYVGGLIQLPRKNLAITRQSGSNEIKYFMSNNNSSITEDTLVKPY